MARIPFKDPKGASIGPNLHRMLTQDTGGEWVVLEVEFYVSEETNRMLLERLSYYIMGDRVVGRRQARAPRRLGCRELH